VALEKACGVDVLVTAERKRLDVRTSQIRLGDPEDVRQIVVHVL
jgi:hypothetical protein